MSLIINISSYDHPRPNAGPDAVQKHPNKMDAKDPSEAPLNSDVRQALSRATAQSSYRLARTLAVRDEVESGTYETPERIEKTIDRLLDVLV